MAEETAPTRPRFSGTLLRLIVLVGAAVLAAVAALVLYTFLLQPMLGGGGDIVESPSPVPRAPAWVNFDQANTTVVMPPDSTTPASLLMYKVSFLCSNPQTASLVEANKSWFTNMLRELHSDRPREEFNQPMLRESIQKQAVIKANEILKQLQGAERPENRIVMVLHDEFFVYDQ